MRSGNKVGSVFPAYPHLPGTTSLSWQNGLICETVEQTSHSSSASPNLDEESY